MATLGLVVDGWGCVTPVGLTALATCAAVRARISRHMEMYTELQVGHSLLGARVPARRAMRTDASQWLANLAAKALEQCRDGSEGHRAENTALIISGPEEFRHHPGVEEHSGHALLSMIQAQLGAYFHPVSRIVREGDASLMRGLTEASSLLERPDIEHVLLGGVDSLLNDTDLKRLHDGHRLRSPGNPQGLVPSEGAAFIRVSSSASPGSTLGHVIGAGVGHERDTVLGPRYSVGDGMLDALRGAVADAPGGEASVGVVVSTLNGERYAAWEALFCHPRFFRTRRVSLDVIYPAMSVGDMGVASSTLALIVALDALARWRAPGPHAICTASSETGLRGACVVRPPSRRV